VTVGQIYYIKKLCKGLFWRIESEIWYSKQEWFKKIEYYKLWKPSISG